MADDITRIVKFQTKDGQEFTSEVDARIHRIEVQTVASLDKLLGVSLTTMRRDSILKEIVLNQAEIRAILLRHNSRLPKKKVA